MTNQKDKFELAKIQQEEYSRAFHNGVIEGKSQIKEFIKWCLKHQGKLFEDNLVIPIKDFKEKAGKELTE